MTSFRQKIFIDSNRHKFAMTQNERKPISSITSQWDTGVDEETFDVNIKIAQIMQNRNKNQKP